MRTEIGNSPEILSNLSPDTSRRDFAVDSVKEATADEIPMATSCVAEVLLVLLFVACPLIAALLLF